MSSVTIAQNLTAVVTLTLLFIARSFREKYHSLETIASSKDRMRLQRYSFYYSTFMLLTILSFVTTVSLGLAIIYETLN